MRSHRDVKRGIFKIRPTPGGFGMPMLHRGELRFELNRFVNFYDVDQIAMQIMELTDEAQAQESHLSEDPEGRP